MAGKGTGKTEEEVAERLAEIREGRSALALEPYECVACETKFYRSKVFASEVAEWKDPICFDCFTKQITGEKESEIIGFAFRFKDPRIRHAFVIAGNGGQWMFVVARIVPGGDDTFEILSRNEFERAYR